MGRQAARWLAAVAALLLVACAPLDRVGDVACVPPPPPPAGDAVYVLPDDGRAPVLDEIDRAACTIDVSIYLLSDDATIDALLRAEGRGVRVRIIYEPAPFGGGFGIVETTESLADSGVELHTGPDPLRFMHAKYLVVDDRVAIVTNQNLTWSAYESNREFGVVTTAPEDVATLAALFDADWEGDAPPVPTDRLIVSPVNARERLLELLHGAERDIRLYIEVIRDDDVIDALSMAAQRGVRVRVLMNAPDDDLDETVLGVLASNGVELRVAAGLYIHAKALVIDDRAVVVGSQNPTATSLDQNREVSLVLEEAADVGRVAAIFERDWARAARWGPVASESGKLLALAP